ncbi:MAG: hypothetical protein HQL17_08675, partial [Candidatus Omnitrophica bacterium]|nr:hypothetical protein [Candidatus Omnitrophota bacterium]
MIDSMKSGAPLETPVLFLIFKRPDVTQCVFDEIRKVRPRQLFVCADGPRANKPGEAELCAQARAIIDQVDWDCQVHKKFSDANLGCRVSVSTGIGWFFDNVESGIILEDDCLPAQSFFWFCQELLARYKDDARVMQISGANYFPDKKFGDATYFFAKLNDISGWATWRRAWSKQKEVVLNKVDGSMEKAVLDYFGDKAMARWFISYLFEAANPVKCGVWSTLWSYAICIHGGLVASPNQTLTTHIGFNKDGENMHDGMLLYPHVERVELTELRHPEKIIQSREA